MDKITKTFKITAPPEVMQTFENFLCFLHFNGGHSGLFGMYFDGDGSFMIKIGDKTANPDFVNTKGQKKVIELFGDFWHKPKERETLQDMIDERRILIARGGYMTWVVWEHELKNIDKLKQNLIWFNKTQW